MKFDYKPESQKGDELGKLLIIIIIATIVIFLLFGIINLILNLVGFYS